MKRFMVATILIISLMFISVLFGMKQANHAMVEMSALTVGDDTGASTHDLQGKQKQLEEMKSFNLFSSIGKSISEGTQAITRTGIDMVVDKVQEKDEE
ncbi:DUF3679 domain-containing protein [Cytobacillus sp. FSL K6-0129]|uniref:DUF3679 domain-containing protein n=1 Tax=Cytobacillus sp. FSL K6-0129 TaxID=2921421 RepID=UPI0030F60D30